jgi:hypothetical protein
VSYFKLGQSNQTKTLTLNGPRASEWLIWTVYNLKKLYTKYQIIWTVYTINLDFYRRFIVHVLIYYSDFVLFCLFCSFLYYFVLFDLISEFYIKIMLKYEILLTIISFNLITSSRVDPTH